MLVLTAPVFDGMLVWPAFGLLVDIEAVAIFEAELFSSVSGFVASAFVS